MEARRPESWIWWKHGVIYHIYPLSFMDSNGDGIGDIQGIISKMNYLSDLGIDAIWLSPVFSSPMVDFGYDVSDYRKIDPVFGTLEDFKELISKAHAQGIRVICDMILNHTSDQHPWFTESRSSKYNLKRNWYIWKDGHLGAPPNNWRSATGGSAWEFDDQTGQYYFHSFFKEQPDLNWRDPHLPEVFFEEVKFWLEFGVDGFRLDVINMIAKDKRFRNNPVKFGLPFFQRHRFTRNRPKSYKIVKELRKLVDQYDNRAMIGEIYTLPPGDSGMAASYLAGGKGIHMTFDFSLLFRSWSAKKYYSCIHNWYAHIPETGWPCNVLSNHDMFRSIDRFPWRLYKDEKAKVAATLLLTLRGTPFVYYGEEIGMRNGKVKYTEIKDPLGKKWWPLFQGRDKARTPMQWNDNIHGGFTSGKPWLPVNNEAAFRNVENQERNESSLLHHYRQLIHLRKTHPALHEGRWVPLINGDKGILAYSRIHEDERIIIILNFTARQKRVLLPEHSAGRVIFSTHRDAGKSFYFQYMQILPFEASIFKA